MDEDKLKILRVTMTVDYFIEMRDEKKSLVNGWTIEEIIEDWFKKYSLGLYHATRDGHEIQGSRKFLKSEVVNFPEKDSENESSM